MVWELVFKPPVHLAFIEQLLDDGLLALVVGQHEVVIAVPLTKDELRAGGSSQVADESAWVHGVFVKGGGQTEADECGHRGS